MDGMMMMSGRRERKEGRKQESVLANRGESSRRREGVGSQREKRRDNRSEGAEAPAAAAPSFLPQGILCRQSTSVTE